MEALQSLIVAGPDAAEATPRLASALEDRDPEIRVFSALALGGIGPEARPAVPALEARLKDEDADVRAAAAEALKSIRDGETAK
jgi:HEAT repeat protein